MNKRIDGLEQGFGNAGTTRQHGRAQRHVDRVGGADKMAQMDKIPGTKPRPKVRWHRPGPYDHGATDPGSVPKQ